MPTPRPCRSLLSYTPPSSPSHVGYPRRARVHRVITRLVSTVSPRAPMGLADGAYFSRCFRHEFAKVHIVSFASLSLFLDRLPNVHCVYFSPSIVVYKSYRFSSPYHAHRAPGSSIFVVTRINNEPVTRSASSRDDQGDARQIYDIHYFPGQGVYTSIEGTKGDVSFAVSPIYILTLPSCLRFFLPRSLASSRRSL